ncbi:hypothetical protein ACF1A5_29320 [Streptomyces sp. NPDC014864]|uniref:hypothetical protein n=1 Tax=Streptomyces sp. NPDC014864 TaxID=3364924 RepID=UPI0036F4EE8E
MNGQATTMGTATWRNSAPRSQAVLLHISDPAVCSRIYGGSRTSCYVKPANNPAQPICDRGASNIAYNAMPYGVTDCYRASLGFEANATNEFGDGVGLAGTGRHLSTLQVNVRQLCLRVPRRDVLHDDSGGDLHPPDHRERP